MKRFLAVVFAAALGTFPLFADAQTLYAATGSNGVNGNLYSINPATAAATLIGPILVGGVNPIGLTGMAMSPVTGVLYGITPAFQNTTPALAKNLVTINTANGNATVIGSLGADNGSDISFNSAGVLYVWVGPSGTSFPRQLATVNLATGAATPLGASGIATNNGGGLAFSPGGVLYVSALGDTGALDTLNPATGAATAGPTLSGAPSMSGTPPALDAMAFSSAGTLYAIDTNRSSSPTTNFLVTINTTTGVITNVGGLPGDMDALAFVVPVAVAPTAPTGIPALSQWALSALVMLLIVFGLTRLRAARRA
jgi:hypothetical protein